MTVQRLLEKMNLVGVNVSIRKHDKTYGLTYVGGGKPSYCCARYGAYVVVESTIIDGILVLYVV